jgi:hypothetical protein
MKATLHGFSACGIEMETVRTLLAIPLFLYICFVEVLNGVVITPMRPSSRRSYATHRCVIRCASPNCRRTLFVIYATTTNDHYFILFKGLCGCPAHADLFTIRRGDGGRHCFYIHCGKVKKIVDDLSRDLSPKARRQIRWSLRQNRLADEPSRPYWMRRAYSYSARRRQRLVASRTVNMTDLIDSLKDTGATRIYTSQPGDKQTRFFYKGADIAAVVGIPPEAVGAYKDATYIQLDCSFRTRPFVYCVAQAIIANEAVPLGFIIGPSESEWLYTTFMTTLWGFIPGYTKLPVLSDQGAGLKAFCDHQGIQQYFCHRHIIQKWGASSAAGMLVARVLRIVDQDEYTRMRPQFLAEAISLRANGHMSKKQLTAFKNWLTMNDLADGIWHRLRDGIARCSNHAERFHGVVNQAVKRARVTSLPCRLRILQEEIVKKIGAYSRTTRRSLNDALSALKRKKEKQCASCTDPACAAYRKKMASRFRLPDFLCPHNVHTAHLHVPELPSINRDEDTAFFYNLEKNPDVQVLDTPVPSFQSDPFKPKAKLEKLPKKKFVVVWDDEEGPETPIDKAEALHDLVYQIGRGIVTGVFYLRSHSRRYYKVDKMKVMFQILTHFFAAYHEWRASIAPNPDEREHRLDLHAWSATYAARWYHWAMKDENCPAGAQFLAGLNEIAAAPDGEPAEDGEPHLAEVDADF